jgi:hypothetical protein
MNPLNLSSSDILVWGIVLHLVGDWPLQNHWMAQNKMKRRIRAIRHGDGTMTPPRLYQPQDRWWDRHPAAYIHAGIHGILLAPIFGWVTLPLAIAHLLIDTRVPLLWWGRVVQQTQPSGWLVEAFKPSNEVSSGMEIFDDVPLYDVGLEVRFWTDQVFHIVCIAVAAIFVGR